MTSKFPTKKNQIRINKKIKLVLLYKRNFFKNLFMEKGKAYMNKTIIIKMFQNILPSDTEKEKFEQTFKLLEIKTMNNGNYYGNSNQNKNLNEFKLYDSIKLENIPLPNYQYAFQKINMEILMSDLNLM